MHIVDEVNDPIVTGMKAECAGYSNELEYPKGTGVMVPDEYVRRVVDDAVTEMKRKIDEYGIPTIVPNSVLDRSHPSTVTERLTKNNP